MDKFISHIESLSDWIGKLLSWSTLFLVLLICLDVFLRYLFNFSLIWIIELEIYLFALIFLGGAAYTFKHDDHVRVDVFYSKLSEKGKARINLIGGMLFLMPWSWVILQVGFHYARISFELGETSAQAGGLPRLYLLKSMIMIGFFFLFLQGLASIFRSIQTLRK